MNMIDFMRANAAWMHADRPDLYPTPEAAIADLHRWTEDLRNIGSGTIETGGFSLAFYKEDETTEEWTLSKKISTAVIDFETGDFSAWSWVDESMSGVKELDMPKLSDLEYLLDEDDED